MRADAPGGPFKIIRSNLNAVTYTDTAAARGKTYYYQVVAVNSYGESAPTRVLPVQIVDLPPPRPANLTATRDGSSVKLEWDRLDGLVYAGHNPLLGIALEHNGVTYNVKRSDKERGGLSTIAANLQEPAFTDTTAKYNESYIYVVTAADRYGESGLSNFAFVPKGSLSDIQIHSAILTDLPWAVQWVMPPAPEQFIAEANSGEVVLRWNPVEGATGYHVKRASEAEGKYQTIGAAKSDTTFTDTTAVIGQTSYYKVTAVDRQGDESLATPVISAIPTRGNR
jgi:fibronectin type 3 domain-containing protein